MTWIAIVILIGPLSTTALAQRQAAVPASQLEMVNAERAFARLGQERGYRESFATWFADDGIGFGPHPYKVRGTLNLQPPPPNAPPIGFNWAPAFGDIAQAGDLGWDTGPVVFGGPDPARNPVRHGMFFSVWKKQPDGAWRVELDLGTNTPAAIAPFDAPFQSSYRARSGPVPNVNVEKETAGLLKVEKEFLAAANTRSVGQAYQNRIADDIRLQRPGAMPIVGKEAFRSWQTGQTAKWTGEPHKADVSRSGDLGYVYGSYESQGAKPEKGYYARVWKREGSGPWRIVMDTISPLPAGVPLQPISAASPAGEKALSLFLSRQWDVAASAYQDYLRQNPNDSLAWSRLGTSLIYLKQYTAAVGSLEQAIKLGGGAALDFYNLACAYALSGNAEKAIDNVEKAIKAGFNDKQQYAADSDLDSLRQSERFKQLMQQLP